MPTLQYQLSGPSLDDLNKTIDQLWDEIKTDPDSLRRAQEAGIDLDRLPSGRREKVIEVRRVGAGLEPASTAIGVGIALGAKVVRDVWTHVLLPRLRRKYGDKAITETKETKPKRKKRS
jgi:hypothetical protein